MKTQKFKTNVYSVPLASFTNNDTFCVREISGNTLLALLFDYVDNDELYSLIKTALNAVILEEKLKVLDGEVRYGQEEGIYF